MSRQFYPDDKFSKDFRNAYLVPFYRDVLGFGQRYIFNDGLDREDLDLQRQGVDTLCQGRDGKMYRIDEKIVRWKGEHYTRICIETASNSLSRPRVPGWIYTNKCHFILYVMEQQEQGMTTGGEAYLINFPKLQEWFLPRLTMFPSFTTDQANRTVSRLVPIALVKRHVGYRHFQITADGSIEIHEQLAS